VTLVLFNTMGTSLPK